MHSLPIDHRRADQLDYQVEHALRQILKDVPFINQIVVQRRSIAHAADLMAVVSIGSQTWNLAIEIKSTGQPRLAKQALQQWHFYARSGTPSANSYFLFAAPFVSESSRAILREAGVGYLDLAGNCYFAFDQVYIERSGFQKEMERRELRSVFETKASRIVRRLVSDPERAWNVQELANSADVSTGLVSQVKTKLLNEELLERRGERFAVSRPADLLKKWAEAYRFEKNELVQFYTAKPLVEADRELSEFCWRQNIEYAFTLFAGARLIGSQYMRVVGRSDAYLLADPIEVGENLGLKRVDSGGNVVLLRPYDSDLLYQKREIDHRSVVADIQLFLDFSAQRGRAQETAEFLLDSRIRPSWEKQ